MTRLVRPDQRRATCYLAVLAVATIVAIIGLSALTTARIAFRSAEGANNVIAARSYAQSALEMGLFSISHDSNWRNTYANDTWVPARPLGDGSYAWKLVDERNGDLTTDLDAPVRLYGKGVAGNAVRTYSVLLWTDLDDTAANLLSNPGIENGTTDWTSTNCDLVADTSESHSGAACLWVEDREGKWDGPRQDVASQLTDGITYETEVWVKTEDYAEYVWLVIWMDTDSDYYPVYYANAQVGNTWTKVTGTFTASWSSTLEAAHWEVETDWSDQEFKIDDAILRAPGGGGEPAALPVVGTWRREVN